MYYQSYEDYMRLVLGYPIENYIIDLSSCELMKPL